MEANELAMLTARLYSTEPWDDCLEKCLPLYAYHCGSALNTWNRYVEDLQDHIDQGTSGRVAGFISETIQGIGEAIDLAPGYLKRVYENGIRNGLPLGAVVTTPEMPQVMAQ
ncbi:hypothetical protein L2E82_11765 [Cichorium intybus]|uniref:Uncharacterized protein n=1 Tax=Cichorium intybus TaxID=13427 RepID=A0ACB9GF80_CICIN|nr:hypothetical protein L2E82_11765 [Cichorium intybus]